MTTFIIGLIILLFGSIFYSKYIETLIEPDNREVPSNELNDGVDYVPMPKGRNSLIHLLNIAGMGPIIGAVQGILFGPIAFILIPIGCIFAGGVHDYFAGGVNLTGAMDCSRGRHDRQILRTMNKIPKYISYIEKEYGAVILDKTRKNREKHGRAWAN